MRLLQQKLIYLHHSKWKVTTDPYKKKLYTFQHSNQGRVIDCVFGQQNADVYNKLAIMIE